MLVDEKDEMDVIEQRIQLLKSSGDLLLQNITDGDILSAGSLDQHNDLNQERLDIQAAVASLMASISKRKLLEAIAVVNAYTDVPTGERSQGTRRTK